MTFQDSRPPISVTWVGKYKVTVFDQDAYEQSKINYPDDEKAPNTRKWEFPDNGNRSKPAFVKKKSAFSFAVKLDKPLTGRIAS